ncbi:MAG TPA: M13 family metallopeptidase [Gemmatimonadales bacterium]|nr:M13 family metallopeptidase [Gemmatimonadales bacterium]
MLRPTTMAAGLLAVSLATAGAQAPNVVSPGDDFFAYANGDWLAATALPAGTERWTARNEINELARRQVAQLLDAAASAPAGSLARRVADFRAAWLDTAAIESKGIRPLAPLLDSIGLLRDKADLTRYLGRDVLADVDPLNWGVYRSSHVLGLSVEPGICEPTPVAFLLQGGLGLPDREDYLSADPAKVSLRSRYRQYIARLLTLAGFGHAIERARGVLDLEVALAQSQAGAETSASDQNADSLWQRADFAGRAPGMDWAAFFDAAGLAGQGSFGVWQPRAVTGLAAQVGSRPLPVWKDYLRFHLLQENVDLLPRRFAEAGEALRARRDAGARGRRGAETSPAADRAEQALDATQTALGNAVGRLYVERYFAPTQKARLQTIVANVIAAFRKRVEAASWMSAETRATALAKLDAVYFGIGYPERWPDYGDLVVKADDPIGNLRRVRAWEYRRALARLGRRVDLKEWWLPPARPAAILIFQQNAYNFPAALLQPPKFDPAASDATNYGAIGAIVGHEVSHIVDLLGMEWDAQRRERRWWTDEDIARFHAAAEPLMRQVAEYQPLPGVAVDAKKTQIEDVADLAGLMAAFEAYRAAFDARRFDAGYVKQQDREFFLGFARSWRSRSSEAGLRTQLASDNHTPEQFRIATVRNLDAWYQAFDVTPGQKLYLEPRARVRVW